MDIRYIRSATTSRLRRATALAAVAAAGLALAAAGPAAAEPCRCAFATNSLTTS
jgi:hypothetical protein